MLVHAVGLVGGCCVLVGLAIGCFAIWFWWCFAFSFALGAYVFALCFAVWWDLVFVVVD